MPFTLTIAERGHAWAGRGPATSTHPTRQAAEAAVLTYVRENWDEEMGTAAPDDPQAMVEEYFAEVMEQYEIFEAAVAVERP